MHACADHGDDQLLVKLPGLLLARLQHHSQVPRFATRVPDARGSLPRRLGVILLLHAHRERMVRRQHRALVLPHVRPHTERLHTRPVQRKAPQQACLPHALRRRQRRAPRKVAKGALQDRKVRQRRGSRVGELAEPENGLSCRAARRHERLRRVSSDTDHRIGVRRVVSGPRRLSRWQMHVPRRHPPAAAVHAARRGNEADDPWLHVVRHALEARRSLQSPGDVRDVGAGAHHDFVPGLVPARVELDAEDEARALLVQHHIALPQRHLDLVHQHRAVAPDAHQPVRVWHFCRLRRHLHALLAALPMRVMREPRPPLVAPGLRLGLRARCRLLEPERHVHVAGPQPHRRLRQALAALLGQQPPRHRVLRARRELDHSTDRGPADELALRDRAAAQDHLDVAVALEREDYVGARELFEVVRLGELDREHAPAQLQHRPAVELLGGEIDLHRRHRPAERRPEAVALVSGRHWRRSHAEARAELLR
mmetsp:Transcript_42009/g.98540  ORF Transcript_42009/g.98540 Transcript_42009/m.98540 type:complete len:482 (-) Transcript_42009:107-1552(-)